MVVVGGEECGAHGPPSAPSRPQKSDPSLPAAAPGQPDALFCSAPCSQGPLLGTGQTLPRRDPQPQHEACPGAWPRLGPWRPQQEGPLRELGCRWLPCSAQRDRRSHHGGHDPVLSDGPSSGLGWLWRNFRAAKFGGQGREHTTKNQTQGARPFPL